MSTHKKKLYEARGKVFANTEFSLGTFKSKKKAKQAIISFKHNYGLPRNNWFIVNFWIEKKEIISYSYL